MFVPPAARTGIEDSIDSNRCASWLTGDRVDKLLTGGVVVLATYDAALQFAGGPRSRPEGKAVMDLTTAPLR